MFVIWNYSENTCMYDCFGCMIEFCASCYYQVELGYLNFLVSAGNSWRIMKVTPTAKWGFVLWNINESRLFELYLLNHLHKITQSSVWKQQDEMMKCEISLLFFCRGAGFPNVFMTTSHFKTNRQGMCKKSLPSFVTTKAWVPLSLMANECQPYMDTSPCHSVQHFQTP